MEGWEKDYVSNILFVEKSKLWAKMKKGQDKGGMMKERIDAIEKAINLMMKNRDKKDHVFKMKTSEGFSPSDIVKIDKAIKETRNNSLGYGIIKK